MNNIKKIIANVVLSLLCAVISTYVLVVLFTLDFDITPHTDSFPVLFGFLTVCFFIIWICVFFHFNEVEDV